MTTDHDAWTGTCPRWLRLWAAFTVCATLVLLTLGAVVTTFRVGMADPVWPTYPWHLLLIEWEEPRPGFLVEHAHRLAGNVVGCCALVLSLGLWHYEPRAWLRHLARLLVAGMLAALFAGFMLKSTPVWLACGGTVLAVMVILSAVALCVPDSSLRLRWLGTVALGGVVLQGMLGGFRVRYDAPWGQELTLFHGFFAQVVFALLVSLNTLTSREVAGGRTSRRVRRWAVATANLALLQVLLGGFVRHTYWPLGQRGHFLVAFLVVAAVLILWRLVRESDAAPRSLRIATNLLAALVALQVSLGVEALMSRLVPMSVPGQAIIRTAHFVVGASLFATAVSAALLALRTGVEGLPAGSEAGNRGTSSRELEVVA